MPDPTTADQPRECRICGCTDGGRDERAGRPCHWVADDLCSACVPADVLLQQITQAKALALGDALSEWAEMNGAPIDESLQAFATFFLVRGFDACMQFIDALDMLTVHELPGDQSFQGVLWP